MWSEDLSDDEVRARLEQRHVPEQDIRWAVLNRDSDPEARRLIEPARLRRLIVPGATLLPGVMRGILAVLSR